MKEIFESLIHAQQEMGVAVADKKGARGGKYCSLQSLKAAAEPALKKHGLGVIFGPDMYNGEGVFSAWLIHTSGEKICITMPFEPDESGNMSRIQGYGSSVTYMKRYLYECITGVTTSKDIDDPDNYTQELSGEPVTLEQAQEIKVLINALPSSEQPKALGWIKRTFQVESASEIPKEKYLPITRTLKKWKTK